MSKIEQLGRVVVVGIAVGAGIPVGANAWHDWCARRAESARAEQYATAGKAALAAGDLELAVDDLSNALGADPQLGDLHGVLLDARVEQLLKEPVTVAPGAAVHLDADLKQALAGPKAGNVRYMLAQGRILQLRDKAEAARTLFTEAAAKEPTLALAQLLLGDAWLKAGDLEKAAAPLQKALELDPASPQASLALGQVRLKQEKWDDAATLLSKAADGLPRNPQALLSLGNARLHQKQNESAVAALEKALALDPNLAGAHELIGEAYAGLGKADAAIGAFRMAWEKFQDVTAYKNLGRVLLQVGRPQEALPVFKTLNSLDDSDPEPLVAISICAQALGDLNSAQAALARAEKILPSVTPPERGVEWQKIVNDRKQALAQAIAKGGGGAGGKDAKPEMADKKKP